MGKRKSIVTFDKKTMLEMEEKEQQEKRPFWRINPKLVPLQFLTFIFYGGMAALYPFLTIHMKSLGFTTTETAIIYGVLPLLCFIGPAITGWAGDKIGNYKLILAIAIGVNVILHMLVYFAVPVYSVTHVPERFATRSIALLLPCQDGSKVPLEMEDFLHFPDAERLGDCASTNSTHPNGTDHVLAFLQSQSCSSTCKMSNEASGSARVCMQTDGCVPVTDLFYRYGFSNSSAHANSPKAVTSNNTECVDSGQPSCFVNCSLSEALPVTCFREVVEGHRPTMFWMYFVFRVISSIALASVFPLLDAATIQMTIDHHGDIGRVKMYSLLAICVWPPLSGVMIDQLGMGFAPAFYVYGILHVASVVVVLLMSLNVKLPAENIWSHVGVLLKNPKVAVFVIVFFFIASAWGVLDSFLFWFMEDTFASQSLWRILLLRKVYGGFLCFARNRIGGKATISQ